MHLSLINAPYSSFARTMRASGSTLSASSVNVSRRSLYQFHTHVSESPAKHFNLSDRLIVKPLSPMKSCLMENPSPMTLKVKPPRTLRSIAQEPNHARMIHTKPGSYSCNAVQLAILLKSSPSNCLFTLNRQFSTNPKSDHFVDPENVRKFVESAKLSISSILSKVFTKSKGSVLDLLAKSLTPEERKTLVDRWGYATSTSASPPTLPESTTIQESVKPLSVEPVVQSAPAVQVVEEVKVPEQVNVEIAKPIVHPIFGELVADLGYKKVYRTNVFTVGQLPVWQKNRTLRSDRALKIAQSMIKSSGDSNHVALPGVITLYYNHDTQAHGIVDGQHRSASLVLLTSMGRWDMHANNVIIDVFDVHSEERIAELFKEINSSEPVRLVDMPGEDGPSDDVREILGQVCERLEKKYPKMFSTSYRCRQPNVNVDNLRDELFQSDYIGRHKIKSVDDLEKNIEAANEKLGARSDADWLGQKEGVAAAFSVQEAALKKARANKFYLGLDKTWVTN